MRLPLPAYLEKYSTLEQLLAYCNVRVLSRADCGLVVSVAAASLSEFCAGMHELGHEARIIPGQVGAGNGKTFRVTFNSNRTY